MGMRVCVRARFDGDAENIAIPMLFADPSHGFFFLLNTTLFAIRTKSIVR